MKDASVANTVERMSNGTYNHCFPIVPYITPLPAMVAIVFGTRKAVPRTVR